MGGHTSLPNIHLPIDSTSQVGGAGLRGEAEGAWLDVKGYRVNKQVDSDCLGGAPLSHQF